MPHFTIQELRTFNEAALSLHQAQDHAELSALVRFGLQQQVAADVFGFDWVDSIARVAFQTEYSPANTVSPELNAFAHSLLPTTPFWLSHFKKRSPSLTLRR